MKEFNIPLLSINLATNTDQKLSDREVPGIELEYLWPKYTPRNVFSGAFVAGGLDGLAISFCVETPHNKLSIDDCLSVYLIPNNSDICFCWEIYPGIIDSTSKTKNLVAFKALNKPLNSNKDESTVFNKEPEKDFFITNAFLEQQIDDEFLYTVLFIPWNELNVPSQPQPNSVWKATINRKDSSVLDLRNKASSTKRPGLQCLLDNTDLPFFYQPDHFASFTFTKN